MPADPALLTAIAQRQLDAVAALLQRDPAAAAGRGASGPSPLLMAAYVRDPAIIDLVRRHTEPDLHEAAALGDESRLRQMLAESPEAIDRLSGDGWSALHLGGFFGHQSIVATLLAGGADPNVTSTNAEANRPLHAALSGACSRSVVLALVEAGADVNAVAGGGITPLHTAASRGQPDIVRDLVVHGARADAVMNDGRTPADLATERGFPELRSQL